MWFWILLGLGAAFVAGIEAASASEQRRRLAPPEKPPTKLLTSAAAHVTTLDIVPSAAHAKSLCQIAITPCQEAFTPPLPQGTLRLIFSGSSAMRQSCHAQWYGLDACYWTSTADQNYLTRHSCLVIDGKEFPQDPVESDRAAHRYIFECQWRGGRIGVLIKSPINYPDANATTGVIDLSVMWSSLLENSVQTEARKREEERRQKALALATLAHLESNFLKPEYQQNFAAKHTSKILNHDRWEWLSEYQQLLNDEPLYTLVQEQHPHVLEFFEARFEVVRIAERLAVEPTPEPPPPEPKRKLTRDEWQAKIERYRQRCIEAGGALVVIHIDTV